MSEVDIEIKEKPIKPIRKVGEVFSKDKATVILCDALMYPGNGGSLVRTLALLGFTDVIFTSIDKERHKFISENDKNPLKEQNKFDKLGCFDHQIKRNSCKYWYRYSYGVFCKQVIHAATGHEKLMDVYCDYDKDDCLHIDEIIRIAINRGFEIFVLEDYFDSDIQKQDLTSDKIMFILGNERTGIGSHVKEFLEKKEINPLRIPYSNEYNGKGSFNVCTAGTIVGYERFRQVNV